MIQYVGNDRIPGVVGYCPRRCFMLYPTVIDYISMHFVLFEMR